MGKELGITFSKKIGMDRFLIINTSTRNFLQIWGKKIIFQLLETPLKVATISASLGFQPTLQFLTLPNLKLDHFHRNDNMHGNLYLMHGLQIQNNIIKDHNNG